MKRNEIALLILIIGISALLSYFTLNSLLDDKKAYKTEVKTAREIKPNLMLPPDNRVFNAEAFNPTIKVKIGDQSGQQPFNVTR